MLLDIWEGEEQPTKPAAKLWRLNCLLYSGAVMVVMVVTRLADSEDDSDLVRDVSEEEEWSLTGAPRGNLHPDRGRRSSALEASEATLGRLRRKSGLHDRMVVRLRGALKMVERRRGRSVRATIEMRKLAKDLKLRRLSVPSIRAQLFKRENRARATRCRLAHASEMTRRLRTRQRVATQGLRALAGAERADNCTSRVDVNAVGAFWDGIWGVEGDADPYLTDWERDVTCQVTGSETDEVPWSAAWRLAADKQSPWKAPGPDGVAAYWLKGFGGLVEQMMSQVEAMIEGRDGFPHWFVRGRTVLIPKRNEASEPTDFRPITCLNSTYKLMTGALCIILTRAVGFVIPEEQRAGVVGRRGCLDALVIDWALAKEAQVLGKNLSVSWVDFEKAFDRVPHSWVARCLETVQAPSIVIRGVGKAMVKWTTNLEIRNGEAGVVSRLVKFRRGLYQGDSLSPFLFTLAIAPLSHMLRRWGGFVSDYHPNPVTHTLFMDDLKIYTGGPEDGRLVRMSVGVGVGTIEEIEPGTPYRYLGVEQIFTTHSREAKARVRAEYLHRVTIIWSSPLGVQEKAAAHNRWAVAVVRYYMPLLEWYRRDLLDVQTRKVLVQCGAHNTAASCARVYLHRSRGGRDLDALTFVWEVEVLSSALYLKRVADQHVEGAVAFMEDYERKERKQTILGLAVQILERYRLLCSLLGVVETGAEDDRSPAKVVKETISQLKRVQQAGLLEEVHVKKIHGVYMRELEKP